MTKLRKSKLDVVEPSYVLQANEYFNIFDFQDDQKSRDLHRKASKAMRSDRFQKRKKFKTFLEARRYANEANRQYGTKFGVTVVSVEIVSGIPFAIPRLPS